MRIEKELKKIWRYGKQVESYILVLVIENENGIFKKPLYTASKGNDGQYYYNNVVVCSEFEIKNLIK